MNHWLSQWIIIGSNVWVSHVHWWLLLAPKKTDENDIFQETEYPRQVWRKYEVKKDFLRLQVDRIFRTVRWGVWPILAQNIEMKVPWIQRCQQKEYCNHKKRNCIIIKWSNVLKQCTILLGIMAPCKLKKSLSTVEVWWQFYSLNETERLVCSRFKNKTNSREFAVFQN